jgi:GNAT superfamily N-acetyltransferase
MSALAAVRPLDRANFPDLEAVFAGKGCSFARGCWCMAYRESGRVAPASGVSLGEHRKARLFELAGTLPSPGLIGYATEGEPAGWVAVGPRAAFAKLARSPVMKPVDDQPVWSVVCFVVPAPHRGRGAARALLEEAIAHAAAQGAPILEGYPIDKPGHSQPQWLWHGTRSLFERAGFAEVARRKPERPVMRLTLAS